MGIRAGNAQVSTHQATMPPAQPPMPAPPSGTISDAARHWQAVNPDGAIQFTPWHMPPSPPDPAWWRPIRQMLGHISDVLARARDAVAPWLAPVAHAINHVWQTLVDRLTEMLHPLLAVLARLLGVDWRLLAQIVLWAGLALITIVAARLIWPMLAPAFARWATRRPPHTPDTPWAPDAAQARALLDEADALAAQGQYDEAVHLLLLRSFEHIAAARPEWLSPATTAREIAQLPAHAEAARTAFGRIAANVEASRYALSRLSAPDWAEARAAYADFAAVRLTP